MRQTFFDALGKVETQPMGDASTPIVGTHKELFVGEYVRCFCCTSTIHAGCEDFRASADIGLEMDEKREVIWEG
jgi:hypothetical protein